MSCIQNHFGGNQAILERVISFIIGFEFSVSCDIGPAVEFFDVSPPGGIIFALVGFIFGKRAQILSQSTKEVILF